jgi:hypothetical protein
LSRIPAMIDSDELAVYLQVSKRTVEDWRLKGSGPAVTKLSNGRVSYRVDHILAWFDQIEVPPTRAAVA